MKNIYICPVCLSKYKEISALNQSGNSLICAKNHCFDCSKEGYYNFDMSNHSADSGDTKEMCECRREFLSSGHYERFALVLSQNAFELCGQTQNPSIVDAGCGEGYYDRVLRDYFLSKGKSACLVGADLAKNAIKLAAKSEKQVLPPECAINFGVSSIFDLPLASCSQDILLSVFAPVGHDEAHRVLKNGGYMIVAGADTDHLYELKSAVYDMPYKNEQKIPNYDGFDLCDAKELKYTFECTNAQIKNLFTMTPYFWKTSKQDMLKLDNIEKLEITAHFFLHIYKKTEV